jgi:hypothetical protein
MKRYSKGRAMGRKENILSVQQHPAPGLESPGHSINGDMYGPPAPMSMPIDLLYLSVPESFEREYIPEMPKVL